MFILWLSLSYSLCSTMYNSTLDWSPMPTLTLRPANTSMFTFLSYLSPGSSIPLLCRSSSLSFLLRWGAMEPHEIFSLAFSISTDPSIAVQEDTPGMTQFSSLGVRGRVNDITVYKNQYIYTTSYDVMVMSCIGVCSWSYVHCGSRECSGVRQAVFYTVIYSINAKEAFSCALCIPSLTS